VMAWAIDRLGRPLVDLLGTIQGLEADRSGAQAARGRDRGAPSGDQLRAGSAQAAGATRP
jgi:hypothetical protein